MTRPSISFSETALSDYASRLSLELEKHGCVITPGEIDKAVRRHSRLAELRPETLVRNIINIAKVIGLLEESLLVYYKYRQRFRTNGRKKWLNALSISQHISRKSLMSLRRPSSRRIWGSFSWQTLSGWSLKSRP